MNELFHPIFWVPVLVGSVVFAAFFALSKRVGWHLSLPISLSGFLAATVASFIVISIFPEIIDAKFRTYKAFYRDLHSGMTRTEVFASLENFYPLAGRRMKPTIMEDSTDRLCFFMNPEHEKEPNCEGIFLTMRDAQLVSKTYSRD